MGSNPEHIISLVPTAEHLVLKEEATLQRFIRYIACGSLITASLCATGQAQTAKPGTNRGTSARTHSAALSAREMLRAGRDLYLRGEIAESLRMLQKAKAGSVDLSSSERAELNDLLNHVRYRSGTLRGHQPVARAQTPKEDGAYTRAGAKPSKDVLATLDKEAQRISRMEPAARDARAKKWLSTARKAFNHLAIEDAREIAKLCKKLNAQYPEDDSPEKLAMEIQEFEQQAAAFEKGSKNPQAQMEWSKYLLTRANRIAHEGDYPAAEALISRVEQFDLEFSDDSISPKALRGRISQMKNSESAIVQVSGEKLSGGIQTAAHIEEEGPTGSGQSLPQEAMRVRSDKLLSAAKTALAAGDIQEAHRLGIAAEQIERTAGLEYGEGEERPSDFVQGLKDQGGEAVTKSDNDNPFSDADSSDEENLDFGAATKGESAEPTNDQVVEARTLLIEARAALQSGDLETAKSKVAEAEKLGSVYKLLDDRPELVREEIAKAEKSTENTKPEFASDPQELKQHAMRLLRQARVELNEGRLQEARHWAEQARDSNAVFGTFEDRPELVLEEIEHAVLIQQQGPGNNSASKGSGKIELEPKRRDPAQARVQSKLLMKEARAAQRAGDLETALRKATQAAELKAPVSEFDDVPAKLVHELKAKIAKSGGNNKGIQLTSNDEGQGEAVPLQQADENEFVQELPSEPSEQIQMAEEELNLRLQQLHQEVETLIFRADRFRETDPEQALNILEEAESKVLA
ncbi:MAG: hypothetical protein KDA68_12975, partial [Planctomycetaceae bacterium]|nr:hypothetical protein [Planctomycetaceae bacterium]